MTNRNEDARQKHLWEDEQERSHTSYLRVAHEADEADAKRVDLARYLVAGWPITTEAHASTRFVEKFGEWRFLIYCSSGIVHVRESCMGFRGNVEIRSPLLLQRHNRFNL